MKIPPNRCHAKKTLDTHTGIIYPTFKQACTELGLNVQQERMHRLRLYYLDEFMNMSEGADFGWPSRVLVEDGEYVTATITTCK